MDVKKEQTLFIAFLESEFPLTVDDLKSQGIDLLGHFNTEWETWQAAKTQVPEWISVDERLPDGYGQVLAINNKGVIRVAEYAFYEEEWRKAPSLKTAKHPITHWMPLPNPTQEQGHD